MTTPTYYTPEISEIHVGFVYQSKNNAQEEFQTYVVEADFDSCVYQHLIDSGELRVKHLDREDIEGEGCKHIYGDPVIDEYEVNSGKNFFRFLHCPSTNQVAVKIVGKEDFSPMAEGAYSKNKYPLALEIRNLTEFRKLMKQLGIKKP